MPIPLRVAQAAFDGDVDAVRAWLGAGGAVDEVCEHANELAPSLPFSEPLIHIAAHGPNASEVVSVLLDAGARYEHRYLMSAVGLGNVETVQVLLPRANVNERFGYWTPLHWAAAGGYKNRRQFMPNQAEMVHLLLKAGASVNATAFPEGEATGETPLMSAAKHGFTVSEVTKRLLQYGADISAADSNNRTAPFYANQLLQGSRVSPDPHSQPPDEFHEPIIWRAPGVAEDVLAILRGVQAHGSWKRYVREPRKQLLVLRRLVGRGRAAPPDGVLARLFPESGGLPDVLFWKVLSFWRSPRDA